MLYGIGKMEDGKRTMEEVKWKFNFNHGPFYLLHYFPNLLIICALKSLPSFSRLAKNDLAASKCSL